MPIHFTIRIDLKLWLAFAPSGIDMSSSSSESCSSRRLTWLMKSCFPNNQHLHQPSALILSISTSTTISSLPDDILLECLSRVPQSTLPSLFSVCRRWAHLLNSPSFLFLRLQNQLLFHTLFCISISNSTLLTATIHCQTWKSWKLSSFVLNKGSEATFSLFSNFRAVSINRKIYIIGREAMLRFDTWTGSLVPKQGMNLQRKKFAAAALAGKIYVAGGSATSSAVEEYDPDDNSWRVIADAPRRRYGCIGASADGVFYVIGGLKIGGGNTEQPAYAYASSMDLYDVTARVWLRNRIVPGGGCVMAACAAGSDVYILLSHAVELSFWKFSACRKKNSFGKWSRIKSPPLPAQVRLDSRVRFSCVGVEDKVVLVQVVGCIDDILRRSGRTERGVKEGLVLIYDCRCEEWSRGVDMPEVMRRAALVGVDC